MTTKRNDDNGSSFWQRGGLLRNNASIDQSKPNNECEEARKSQNVASEHSLGNFKNWISNFTSNSLSHFDNNFDCTVGVGFCHSEEDKPRLW